MSPSKVVEIEWKGDGGKILGAGALLQFDVEPPRFISGLRFRLSVTDPGGMTPAVRLQLQSDTRPEPLHYNCRYEATTGNEAEILVDVDDRISRVILFPNNRVSSFQLSSIELLVPEDSSNESGRTRASGLGSPL